MTTKLRNRDVVIQEYNYVKLTMLLDEFLFQNDYEVETVENSYVKRVSSGAPFAVCNSEIQAYEIALAQIAKNSKNYPVTYKPCFYSEELIEKALEDRKKVK